jgi:beta-ribofuranosylaminobenzene 5'-phosphate synthase
MRCVRVTAPAHLHAGNMDLNGDLGRLYGTVGFAIDYPRLVVDIEKASVIEANDPFAERFARIVAKGFGVNGFRVVVRERFPEYIGLGYVTTLGISIGMGVARLYELGYGIEDVALMIRRGLVTALGLYACRFGGFIVEGGFRRGLVEKCIPPLIFRGEIPDNWLFIVAVPEAPRKRIVELRVGGEERILQEVFMSSEEASYLSRLVLIKMIPSFIERDIVGFGEALTEFNRRLGLVWQKYQGGIYCDPIVEKGIEIMLKHTYGACQSSWGPTFYGILDSEEKALKLVEELKRFLSVHGGGDVFIAKGRNRGLEVMECG